MNLYIIFCSYGRKIKTEERIKDNKGRVLKTGKSQRKNMLYQCLNRQ